MAVTVKLYVPAAVGVPEIVPSLFSVNQLGKSLELHVMVASPLATRVWLYLVFTVPSFSLSVVIFGG